MVEKKLLSFVFLICFSAAAEKQPNVVFLMADDLGYGDLACYGHPYAKTPNLDRLAEQGTRFTQFYAPGAVCRPSRTGFMTGRQPWIFLSGRKSHDDYDLTPVVHLPRMLKENGYVVGHIGKWHLGGHHRPNGTYGFDVVNEMNVPRPGKNRGRDDYIFTEGLKFIEQNKDRPFYLNLWAHTTHYPVDPDPSFVELFESVEVNPEDFPEVMQEKLAASTALGFDAAACLRNYMAEVYTLDRNVGRVLDLLDELGLREKTIVVFASDQGAAPVKLYNVQEPRLVANHLGFNGNRRGGKHTYYEGGVRIPFIVRWPGRIPAGEVNSDSILYGLDWVPTVCALTGTPYDPSAFDGVDVSGVWLKREELTQRTLFWGIPGPATDDFAPGQILIDGWKLQSRAPQAVELYNLNNDPQEQVNLATKNPERRSEMMAMLLRRYHQDEAGKQKFLRQIKSIPAPVLEFPAKAPAPKKKYPPRAETFVRLDRNNDEQLTRAEFPLLGKEGDSRFQTLDKNGDGMLSKEEFVNP